MYESIVRGENVLEPGLPEAFNVLVNELKALALSVELVENESLSDDSGSSSDASEGEEDGLPDTFDDRH
jgi:DNA-directed RNA polymerase subunit beta